MYLQQFEFEITYRPGKDNSNADALSREYEDEISIFLLEVENGEGEEDEDVHEISKEIPDIFTPQISRETSREIPLIRINGPLEKPLSDTEYEADDELRQIEKWTIRSKTTQMTKTSGWPLATISSPLPEYHVKRKSNDGNASSRKMDMQLP